MLETLKYFLDSSWWYTLAVFGTLGAAFAIRFGAPASCEDDPCAACPWNVDHEQRRRFWTWRVRYWLVDCWCTGLLLGWTGGRVVLDPLLGELAWTWPLFGAFSAWLGRELLKSLRGLDRARARLSEVPS